MAAPISAPEATDEALPQVAQADEANVEPPAPPVVQAKRPKAAPVKKAAAKPAAKKAVAAPKPK